MKNLKSDAISLLKDYLKSGNWGFDPDNWLNMDSEVRISTQLKLKYLQDNGYINVSEWDNFAGLPQKVDVTKKGRAHNE